MRRWMDGWRDGSPRPHAPSIIVAYEGGNRISSTHAHHQPIGISQRTGVWLLWILLAGALSLAGSLFFHANVTTRQVTLPVSSVTPLEVTVVVEGTSTHPGLVGFLATVHPRTNILSIVPLPGSIHITLPNGAGGSVTLPAWKGVSSASPQIVNAAIDQATGFHASHYFFMPLAGLKEVFRTLAQDTSTWPTSDTVSRSLHILGYPKGTDRPGRELALLNQLLASLPQMTPLDASSLMGVAISSSFNLSQYELFVLGNYVRGDVLKMSRLSSLPRFRKPRRRHG